MLHNGKDVVIHVSRKGCEDGDEAGDRARDAIARLTGLDEEGVEDLVRFIPGNCVPGSCLLYTSPSPRDRTRSRMPSSA